MKIKYVDLLLIGEIEKNHYVLIKDFNTLMYDHRLHRRRKIFCHYCLQGFRTVEKLEYHVKDCFKINRKRTIDMPKKSEYIKVKNLGRKVKSPFMIYADFKSILVPEDNEKQNLNESCTHKYQKYGTCSYSCKLDCVDDKFIKPFKSHLGKDGVYNFINSLI